MRVLWSFCVAVNGLALAVGVSEHRLGFAALGFAGVWASLVSLSYAAGPQR